MSAATTTTTAAFHLVSLRGSAIGSMIALGGAIAVGVLFSLAALAGWHPDPDRRERLALERSDRAFARRHQVDRP
jgi:hypothetical protein